VTAHGLGYVARRNIVHAYDVVAQLDAVDKSGNVTLSATDILSTPEWFFRVNRALKVLEPYIPYELATTSTVPTIYADDLFIIYDLGASVNAAKAVYAFDKLVSDGASHAKSYSPLFFSLLRRRVPIRYLTLGVADVLAVADTASPVKIKSVSGADYVVFDSASYAKSYSPLFFSLLRRRVPVVYKMLAVLDAVSVKDSASVVKIKAVSVLDSASAGEHAAARKFSVPASDFQLVHDSASAVPIKMVDASDYVVYDYVPSMSPSDIRYRSLYANVGMRTISVFDKVVPYESVWVGSRVITVNALDYPVSDSAVVVKRSVNAFDIIGRENVNIVRL